VVERGLETLFAEVDVVLMTTHIDAAKAAILESSETSSVYIGSESLVYKKRGQWFAKYSTVIVLHRDSRHGCKIFYNSVDLPDYKNLKQRLMTEVSHAVEAATEIVDYLGNRSLSIHLDLNPDPRHKSNVAVKEALGWVQGALGITAEVKPNSWAASHCADHAVRHLK